MKHYGDITKLNGYALPVVDIITGGSPCQDLSVAGKRAGLAGERSGLFMEQIRLIKEMRDECVRQLQVQGADINIRLIRPRYMVWENVPGAFSSNKGEDFRAVLEETAKVAKGDASIPGPPGGKWPHAGCIMGDGWSIAWRVHDAQFWGVPQRRKRIALVADFGGDTAPEILFERESMPGNTSESGKAGQGITTDVKRGIDPSSYLLKIRGGVDRDSAGKKAGKGPLVQTELSATLGVSQDQTLIAFEPGAASRVGGHVYEDGLAGTLRAKAGDNQQAVVYGISSYDSNAMKSTNPYSGVYEADTARTLDLNGGSPACNQGGMAVVQGTDVYNGTLTGEVAATLTEACGGVSTSGAKVVCLESNGTEHHAVCVENHPQDSRVKIREDGICQTLDARMGMGGGNVPMVMYPEKTTGSLMAFGYDKLGTQEALNGMYVVEGSAWDGSQVSPTLTANNANGAQRMPDKDNFNAVVQSMETFHCTNEQDKVQTLKARDYKDPQIVAYGLDRAAYNQGQNAKFGFSVDEEKVGAQTAKGPGAVCSAVDCRNGVESADKNGSLQSRSSNNINSNNVCRVGSVVRRLTPLECERLQGFPTIRKVRFTEMTKDEYIAWNINEGNIVVDTEYGKVFATRGLGGVKLDEPKELMGSVVNGYKVVSIRNGKTKMQCRIHRIVWIAEHGIIPDGYVIDHINNDKQDNRRCNLQLLTAAENSTKARMDGLYKIHEDSGSAKITDEVHDFIQYVYGNTDLSIKQLSEIFGISKSRVHQIMHDEPWTDIGEWVDSKGKKHKDADSPRYKALGNSIALPFWEWMAGRMVEQLKIDGVDNPTMASLFDGIGGFPLVYSRNGCTPIWASEIEEFPIAVTKVRFPD